MLFDAFLRYCLRSYFISAEKPDLAENNKACIFLFRPEYGRIELAPAESVRAGPIREIDTNGEEL